MCAENSVPYRPPLGADLKDALVVREQITAATLHIIFLSEIWRHLWHNLIFGECSHLTHVCVILVAPIFSLRHPTKCSGRFGCERVFRTDCDCVRVYIHLFAQRYPACVRPTGVARLSIVEVNKNPSLTKREQTAAVCSGFPNKHSTSRATDRDRQTERERERETGSQD